MKRDLTGLFRRASVEPSTLDEQKRTVEVVWTTGARVFRQGFFSDPFFEELEVSPKAIRLDRLNNGAPVLNSHDSAGLSSILGVVERAWIEKGEGRALIRFSEREDVQPIFREIVSGIIRNVSVGYRVNKFEKASEENGVPVYRATDWTPFELSIVPIGADDGAKLRGLNETNLCEVEERMAEVETAQETTENPAETAEISAPESAPEAAPAEVEPTEAAPETESLERSRVSEILELSRAGGVSLASVQTWIATGEKPENVRKEILKMTATTETITTARIEAGAQDEVKTRAEGMEAVLLHRAMPTTFKITDQARAYVGMSLSRMAEEILGDSARGMARHQIARRALMTSNFVEILGNTANKVLRASYTAQPKTFEPFVVRSTLPDYKPAKRVAFGEAPDLRAIAEGASYETGTIGESAETITVAKYGRAIHMSDALILGDDLGAFTRLGQLAGSAAARLESKLVYDVLLNNPLMADGKAIFHADHGNIAAVADLTVAGMSAARKLMRVQKGIDGVEILDLAPAFLVVGPEQETEAAQLLASTIVPNTVATVNPFQGSLNLIVDSRITGQKWFLIAAPSTIDTIEVATLEGMSGPELTQETEFDNDCVKFKVKHVIGVKAIDYRGMVYNPGPA